MIEKFCVYGKSAGCTECNYVVYAQCPVYKKAHLGTLIRELRPLNFTWDKDYRPYETNDVIQLSGSISPKLIGKLKSAAVNWAIGCNRKIKRLDTNQVLSRVIKRSEESPASDAFGYFLDIQRLKNTTKEDEVRSCIDSFVSDALDNGCKVFILDRYLMNNPLWFKVK